MYLMGGRFGGYERPGFQWQGRSNDPGPRSTRCDCGAYLGYLPPLPERKILPFRKRRGEGHVGSRRVSAETRECEPGPIGGMSGKSVDLRPGRSQRVYQVLATTWPNPGSADRRFPAGPLGYVPVSRTRSPATHSALPQVRPEPRRGLPHWQAGRKRASQAA